MISGSKKSQTATPLRRRCHKCKKWKRLSSFYRKRGGKYGRNTICKACKKLEEAASRARARFSKENPNAPWLKEIVGEALVEAPIGRSGCGCELCKHMLYCEERVRLGLPALCEAPDRADLERAKELGVDLSMKPKEEG